MSGLVVLNTRPREQSAELTRLLTSRGFHVVEAPATAISSAWDPAELQTTRDDLSRGAYAWVVLPSQNAARGLEDALSGTQVVCGAATAAALGVTPVIALERFSAAAALDALRSRLSPRQKVFVPRAAEGRDELILGLQAAGVEVIAPVAYHTMPVNAAAERLRAGGIDAVALCSPSGVKSVAPAIPVGVAVVCLGETTAEAARALGIRVDRVAAATNMLALVDAIELAVGTHV